MSTLVFHSINELQDYLNTAPEDESIRVSVVVENNDGESCNDGEENSKEGGEKSMNDTKSMIKNALILSAITLVAGVLLGLVYQVTKDPIAYQEKLAQDKINMKNGVAKKDEDIQAKVAELIK